LADWQQLGQLLLEDFAQKVQSGLLDPSNQSFEILGKGLKRLEETLKFLSNLKDFLERKEEDQGQRKFLEGLKLLKELSR
jgi:hypothetical protein